MLDMFLLFNRMVLDSATSLLTVGLAVIAVWLVQKLAGVILIVLFVIFCTLFTSAPFVPTKKKSFEKMFAFAGIKPGDKVYDLGCGNGQFVFEAERQGAQAVGIEMNPVVYALALFHKWRRGSKSKILNKNLHQVDLRDADVIFCYLMPKAMKRLDEKFKKELKKGCKIVCHGFELPGWKADVQLVGGSWKQYPVFSYTV